LENLPKELLPSPHAYFGMKGNRDLRTSYTLLFNDAILPKKAKSKRYIGVGYKDKGSCRDVAFDSSPHWKEVATFFSNQEREAEESIQDPFLLAEEDDT
jgi:hypothetical protein